LEEVRAEAEDEYDTSDLLEDKNHESDVGPTAIGASYSVKIGSVCCVTLL